MARQTTPSTAHADATRRVFEARTGRTLSGEDVREISTNLAGFFGLLAGWSMGKKDATSIPGGTPVDDPTQEVGCMRSAEFGPPAGISGADVVGESMSVDDVPISMRPRADCGDVTTMRRVLGRDAEGVR